MEVHVYNLSTQQPKAEESYFKKRLSVPWKKNLSVSEVYTAVKLN